MKPTAPLFNENVPIDQPQASAVSAMQNPADVPIDPPSEISPLLLIVEEFSQKRRILTDLFESLQCRVFMVDNHTQAMAWAPVLPFSAIILNGALPDTRSMAVRRLHYFVQENLVPPIPIWAMVPMLTSDEKAYWRGVGVSMLLIQPLERAMLELSCAELMVPSANFYYAYDAQLRQDFPASIAVRLPELDHEIGKQVLQLHSMLMQLPDNGQHALICQQAHAVKSGSLSLGYFRLAALMGEIEHAVASKNFDHLPQHWQIIADSLERTFFEGQKRVSA